MSRRHLSYAIVAIAVVAAIGGDARSLLDGGGSAAQGEPAPPAAWRGAGAAEGDDRLATGSTGSHQFLGKLVSSRAARRPRGLRASPANCGDARRLVGVDWEDEPRRGPRLHRRIRVDLPDRPGIGRGARGRVTASSASPRPSSSTAQGESQRCSRDLRRQMTLNGRWAFMRMDSGRRSPESTDELADRPGHRDDDNRVGGAVVGDNPRGPPRRPKPAARQRTAALPPAVSDTSRWSAGSSARRRRRSLRQRRRRVGRAFSDSGRIRLRSRKFLKGGRPDSNRRPPGPQLLRIR